MPFKLHLQRPTPHLKSYVNLHNFCTLHLPVIVTVTLSAFCRKTHSLHRFSDVNKVNSKFKSQNQGCRRADFSAKFAYFGRIRTCRAENKNLRPKAENRIFWADLAEFCLDWAEIGRIQLWPILPKNGAVFPPQKCKFSRNFLSICCPIFCSIFKRSLN